LPIQPPLVTTCIRRNSGHLTANTLSSFIHDFTISRFWENFGDKEYRVGLDSESGEVYEYGWSIIWKLNRTQGRNLQSLLVKLRIEWNSGFKSAKFSANGRN